MALLQEPDQRWFLDFKSDSLACGRRFRLLNVIDDHSRECLSGIVDTWLSGRRVVEGWRTDYSTVRPRSSLGGMAPAEFTNRPRQGPTDTKAS